MDPALAWAILGLVLVITELMTGTFYLVMLALAAFGAAGTAYLGHAFPAQSIVAAVVAAAGCFGVHLWRAKSAGQPMPQVDAGMPASFENWIDAGARRARVRYRGTSWDAHVEGGQALEPGAPLVVVATEGNTLKVATKQP